MCDLRTITGVIINGKTIEVKGVSRHFYSWSDPGMDNLDPGIYSIGASGVGQYYYDGKNWHSDYKYSIPNIFYQCEFISNGCLWDDYTDVEIQKET